MGLEVVWIPAKGEYRVINSAALDSGDQTGRRLRFLLINNDSPSQLASSNDVVAERVNNHHSHRSIPFSNVRKQYSIETSCSLLIIHDSWQNLPARIHRPVSRDRSLL